MFKSLLLLGAAAIPAAGAGAQSNPLATDAAAFGAREAVQQPDLSADGSSVLYITPGPGPSSVALISNLVTGKSQVAISADGTPEKLRWCNFVSSSRMICRITGTIAQQFSDSKNLVGFSRLLAVNADQTNAKMLGQKDSVYDERLRQFDASVIDWMTGSDGTVMLQRDYVPEAGKIGSNIVRTKDGLGVDLVDTDTMKSKTVETPSDTTSSYMTDGRGNVRLMEVPELKGRSQLTGRLKYMYRTASSRDWKTVADYQKDEFVPLAVDAETDSLYALKKKSGRFALYRIKLDGTLAETLIAENPRVDIDNVVRFGDGQRVVGYTYAEDKRHAVYFDPEFKAMAAALSKAIPKLPLINFVDASADGRKLLVFAESDTDPGRYYLFDRGAKTLNEAMLARPQLQGRQLAEMKAITLPGAGGVSIPAYLTLPPGKEAKNLPAVVLPHGGPSARDEWGFDWIAQFLAARGYAVIQPQFRGSAGFGDTWLNENGFRNWRTSIGDVSQSARWLASQGIADPKRVAIVGWSYGGYAALQSAATDPGLFKAVVAIAPVTDLGQLKDDFRNFTNHKIVEDLVGSGPHVTEGSPLRNAAAIQAPVLLVHGDLDTNVAVIHSQKMDAALHGAGKQSELLLFPGLDHQLDDSKARAEVLTKIGALLDRTIGH
jgi:dipeptidyl aminopeptidase/acylaminoacyl peptidase